jgi:hypothetical protein
MNPQAAQNILRMLPNIQSPQQLGPALLFFVAALRGNDFSAWAGDRALDILRRAGKGDLISRLTSDFTSLSRAASEPLPNDWRGMMLPFAGQGELQNIAVYYKQEDTKDETGDPGKQTRFIFDLDLNRMGPVQLDGLFKRGRLDLVVRTETDLSDTMRQTMRQNYADVLRYEGLSGELSFHGDSTGFVKIITKTGKLGLFT